MSNNMSHVFDLSCIDMKCEETPAPKEKRLPSPTFPVNKPEIRNPTSDEVVLYYYPYSYYSQVVLMAMYHRQIPFTGCALDIRRGDQFSEDFLRLCPRGEVPVLQDGINGRTYTDSLEILHHLEHNPLLGAMGYSLEPDDPQEKFRCEEFARKLHRLKLDTLTFGSVLFDDLDIEPQGQFAIEANRDRMREYLRKRRAIYRTEALNFPEYAGMLKRKLDDIQHEWHFIEKREDYETLLIAVERELDECEAELGSRHHRAHPQRRGSMIGTDTWWLCSHEVCIADIFLGILIWRLYELGFYKRMIQPRPYLTKYFERLQRVDSFGRATHPVVVDTTTIPDESNSGTLTKRIPWYLLLIPIATMLVCGLWGYSTRRHTNKYGYYTIAAALIYTRWRQSRNIPRALEQKKLKSTDDDLS